MDPDDLDDYLARLRPELRLDLATTGDEGSLDVAFERLEDFHPDRLLQRVSPFDELAALYRSLPQGASAAREEGTASGSEAGASEAEEDDRPAGGRSGGLAPGGAIPAEGGLLDQVVARTEGPEGGGGQTGGASGIGPDDPRPRSDDAFDEYVRELVRPHRVEEERPGAEQVALRERLEDALGDGLRALMHHPRFRALESSWRGLRFLVRRIETGPDLTVHALDVSRAEVAADLEAAAEDVGSSVLVRRLVEERAGTPGAEPWSLLVGLYAFGPHDVGLLRRIATLARAAGAPFLASARPELAGVDGFDRPPARGDWDPPGGGEAWRALRASEVAPWLGLALPRFLLRLPYGPDDAPCETFPFRETASPPRHEDYLWGDPALACAAVASMAHARGESPARPSDREVDRLPLHVYATEGGSEAKPCAETLLTDTAASELMDRGFIPLRSVKERDAVRVGRLQSIAEPPTRLAGLGGGPD